MSQINIKENKTAFFTKFMELAMMALIAAFFLTDLLIFIKIGYANMRQKAVMSISVELSAIAVCGFLYFSGFVDDRKSKFRSMFLVTLFFEAFAFFLDNAYWFTAKNPEYDLILSIANCLLYLCTAVVFVTFWGCEIEIMGLKAKMQRWILYAIRILMGLYMIAVLLNLKFGFFYKIKDGNFIRAQYSGILEFSFPLIICAVLLFYAIKIHTFAKIKITFIVMSLLPIFAMVLQHFFYFSWILYISVLIATMVLYENVQVTLGHKIEEFRNRVMISQIQPHFMYNTLTTIKALCRTDPELAANTITNFADYLRGNMDFASLETTIPFERELRHTKIYTEIEALRFDNIKFEFNIEDSNFDVPALCVQPMVENAVRHGVRSRKDGHILIHTFEEPDYHVIVVKDNGKGFDKTQFNGSRTHIGLLNTRLRIEHIVNGKFEVESIPDKGVTITMRIPKITE